MIQASELGNIYWLQVQLDLYKLWRAHFNLVKSSVAFKKEGDERDLWWILSLDSKSDSAGGNEEKLIEK